MHPDIEKILIRPEAIQTRVAELGQEITKEYAGKELMLVGILKGALPFLADLMRAIDLPLQYDVMAVSSYGKSTQSSGAVRIIKDLDSAIADKHILIVEDIIDTGLTLKYIKENLLARRATSVKICTLLDKPSRRKMVLTPDYNGFAIPDVFAVGYGLDYAENYRNLPYIGVLKREVYTR